MFKLVRYLKTRLIPALGVALVLYVTYALAFCKKCSK